MKYTSLPVRHEVPAADFVRHFGVWRDQAQNDIVSVTKHGRPTHVLISAELFDELKSRTGPGGSGADVRSQSLIGLLDKVRDCLMILDDNNIIKFVNEAGYAFFGRPPEELIGQSSTDLFPGAAGSFGMRNVERTRRTGEHLSVDLQSVSKEGAWLHLETIRIPEGVALKFHDITEEIHAHRFADLKESIIDAMHVDGALGCARISARGIMEWADARLSEMAGLKIDQALRVKFTTMFVPSGRVVLQNALENVLDGGAPERLDAHLITSHGAELPVRVSLKALRGEIICEGAVAVIRKL